MKPGLPPSHLLAWRAFYVTYWKVSGRVEDDLAAAGLPSLSWYDVLYQLYCAPEQRLRMSELAAGALMSRSGLTRLVDRLEKEKLLERQTCPSDKRGFHAHLTPKGLETLRKIWPVYRAGIAREFAAPLTETEADAIATALAKIAGAPATATRPGS